jgi:hypothetical protein
MLRERRSASSDATCETSDDARKRRKKNCEEIEKIFEIHVRDGLNLSQIEQTPREVIRFSDRFAADQMSNLRFSSSFTACGLAFPPVSFIT